MAHRVDHIVGVGARAAMAVAHVAEDRLRREPAGILPMVAVDDIGERRDRPPVWAGRAGPAARLRGRRR